MGTGVGKPDPTQHLLCPPKLCCRHLRGCRGSLWIPERGKGEGSMEEVGLLFWSLEGTHRALDERLASHDLFNHKGGWEM